MVIAQYLITDALDFLYLKAVSGVARDSRLQLTLTLRIYLVERQSYCPASSIFVLQHFLEASLSRASASRSIAGHYRTIETEVNLLHFFRLPRSIQGLQDRGRTGGLMILPILDN